MRTYCLPPGGISICQDWVGLDFLGGGISEVHHHEESIDNDSYEIMNADMEGGLVQGCVLSVRKTYEN